MGYVNGSFKFLAFLLKLFYCIYYFKAMERLL